MLFPTIDFAVFFVIVFTGSWMLRPYAKVWRWFLLLASCVFYLDPFNPGAFLKILKHHATTRPARAAARHPKPSKNNKPPAPPAVAPPAITISAPPVTAPPVTVPPIIPPVSAPPVTAPPVVTPVNPPAPPLTVAPGSGPATVDENGMAGNERSGG